VEVCEDEGPFRALNRHFWVNQREGRPYVTLKWAESADGLIAGMRGDGQPDPRPISCREANRLLHSLRHESQAICIGKNTALIDDPSLTTRHWPGRDPVRIVFDQNLELPRSLRIFQKGSWIVINSKLDQVEGDGRFWKVADSRDLRALLSRLYSECKIGSILVEGGRNLSQQFLDAGIWDEVVRCVSPVNLHSGVKAPRLKGGLVPTESLRVGTDLMEQYFR
jgi:diaminohydroxyphosphoribosylaminopyrimidine deaminase/5-amino-6-(5-phosphoribosylamino)uracil reductase